MAAAGKYIIVDTNIIINFSKAKRLQDLIKIFHPLPIKILDMVVEELQDYKGNRKEVDDLISSGSIQVIKLSDLPPSVTEEYLQIKKLQMKGKGESACLAAARICREMILASSDFKDVSRYCDFHKIDFLGTMDFLCKAKKDKIFTEEECDIFLEMAIKKRANLPVMKMANFECRDISKIIS